jgi:hypothetical protein
MVGIYYYEGKPGVQQDYRAAFEWFTKATNYRYVKPKISTIPTSPLSDEKKKESERLSEDIHELTRQIYMEGVPLAQEWLGKMYYLGNGVPQNYVEAVKWYRKAAEQGHAESQLLLGTMYFTGQGVAQDYVTAHMWFNLASVGLTGETRETAVGFRDQTASKMTPSQITEAQRLARKWRPNQPATTFQSTRK